MNRRLFVSGALGLFGSGFFAGDASATGKTDADAGTSALNRLISRYDHLETYSDSANIRSSLYGLPIAGRTAMVFQRPDRLCMQVFTQGKVAAGVLAHGDEMGSWSDQTGWESLDRISRVLASAKGDTALLGLVGHWIVSLLFPPDVVYGSGLRGITEAACAPDAEHCQILSGRLEGDSGIKVSVDSSLGLITSIETVNPVGPAKVAYQPAANPAMNFDNIAAEFRRDPSHPFLFHWQQSS